MMKRIIILFLLIIFFLLIKLDNKNQIITLRKNNVKYKIAISYPKTPYIKLNSHINKIIKMKYDSFISDYNDFNSLGKQTEFKINYVYKNISKRYISILLSTNIINESFSNKYTEISIFNFDKIKNSFFKIDTISKNINNLIIYINEDIKNRNDSLKEKDLITKENINTFDFFINLKHVTIYIPHHDENFSYLLVNVPMSYFSLENNT
jgi:hypothetical protein